MLTGSEIRRKFLDFFVQKGHREVHSSSLVPHNDPTLLFTNAGMNQFKDVFLGLERRVYTRATSSQKCVRAGGKHNDLENVGFTNRHHTFFEMLGNFSFGDYFKKDAIAYAWELITSLEWFGIPKDKLYATIFNGEGGVPRDAEAYELWLAQGVSKDRVFEFGLKDNFWQMGETGPCGPCSEIHYDMGPAASDQGHTDCAFGCDCGRYVEIWNLVFMQFDRDSTGKLNPLPKPSIDTGMGLERITAVLQGVVSNFDTDLFQKIIGAAAALAGIAYGTDFKADASLRIIADHVRAATFLVSDGVIPSNDGRGYVLRKIIRRAVRHGRLLGIAKPFMYRITTVVRDEMADAYPDLLESHNRVSATILDEEQKFARTLEFGWKRMEEEFGRIILQRQDDVRVAEVSLTVGHDTAVLRAPHQERLSGIRRQTAILRAAGESVLFPGDVAFRLYETYGLPKDFIQESCRDMGFDFDQAGFDSALRAERDRARASWKGAAKQAANPAYQQLPKSVFEGYLQTRSEDCEVLTIIKNGQGVQALKAGEEGEVILDHTPFYAESGGQVGDRGYFYSDELNAVVAEVKGTYYPVQGVRAHQVVVKSPFGIRTSKSPASAQNAEGWGTQSSMRVPPPSPSGEGGGFDFGLRVGDKVDAVVDTSIREATMRNHTATHLLHAGLRELLGKHVKQAGSLVAPNHLRFDFSHFTAVEDEELQDIEDLINKEVLRNQRVEVIENVPLDVAVNEYHAMALFGEKYGDRVRVIKIGDFSTELCGGTHTGATGEIGLIKILKEGSVSSGVRRVEAITGEGSLQHFRKDHELENVVSRFVVPSFRQKQPKDGAPALEGESKSPPLPEGEGWGTPEFSPAQALKLELEKKDAEIKRLARELDQARMKQASSSTANIGEKIKDVRGVKVLAHRVDNLERPQMRTLVDQLRDKLGSGVVVLGSATNGTVSLIVGVTKDLTSRIQAGKVIGPVAQKVGGKGGGRPDLAEAGGKDPGALDSALHDAYGVVEKLLPEGD
jgi:alanyl-tRNA synthetase